MHRLAPCLAALALTLACSSMSGPAKEEPARKDIVIQFDNAGVTPSPARMIEGGSVAFVNMSDSYAAIHLPLADASKFECKDLRPNFMKTATGLDSIPVASSDMRITLPCSLKKGTYPFKVDLFGRIASMGNPDMTLSGTLVVE